MPAHIRYAPTLAFTHNSGMFSGNTSYCSAVVLCQLQVLREYTVRLADSCFSPNILKGNKINPPPNLLVPSAALHHTYPLWLERGQKIEGTAMYIENASRRRWSSPV